MSGSESESTCNGTGMARERRDLVLVMTDQQRFDQVGYASSGHFETPAIDALAKRGVVFDTAFSAATTCVPARTALLTGLHPHRTPAQENGDAVREGFWALAHALRHAGYETALMGKMHFAPVHAPHGFETMRCASISLHRASDRSAANAATYTTIITTGSSTVVSMVGGSRAMGRCLPLTVPRRTPPRGSNVSLRPSSRRGAPTDRCFSSSRSHTRVER